MQFQNMNIDALAHATQLLVGADATVVIAKTYHAFNIAMQTSFEQGRKAGYELANEDVEDRLDNAFDEGFEQGSAFQKLEDAIALAALQDDAEQAIEETFDDGYLEGVSDARRLPKFADDTVQRIINDRADEAFEALEDLTADDEGLIDEA
ncbi:hypothetical protein [Bradyrhizobium sp. USDA 4350]